jgi:hypothetical protein
VGAERLALADLGAEAQSQLIMAALPTLVDEARDPEVARLILIAARGMPPERETPEGVARRALLARTLIVLLSPIGRAQVPVEALQIASELLDLAGLQPGGRERREIEELVFEQLERARPSAALRALAAKLGFATAPAATDGESDRDHRTESAAS